MRRGLVLLLMLSLAVLGDSSLAGAQSPDATDPAEEPTSPPEEDGEGSDEPTPTPTLVEEEETPDEPAPELEGVPEEQPETESVPIVVWVGAGILVVLAVVWGMTRSSSGESSEDEFG